MSDSFFDSIEVDKNQAGSPPAVGDALGIGEAMDILRDVPRMESLELVSDASRILDTYGKTTTVTFDENAKYILVDDLTKIGETERGKIQKEEVVTTVSAAEYVLNGTTYFLRPVRFSEDSEFGSDVFIVIDESKEWQEIMTRNPFIIKLETGDGDGEIPGLEVRSVNGVVRDDRIAITTLREQLDTIEENESKIARIEEENEERQAQQSRRATEERLREIEIDRQREAASKRSIFTKIGDFLIFNQDRILASSIGSLIIGGAIYGSFLGIEAIVNEANDFDCKTECNIGIFDSNAPRLSSGTKLNIGDTVHPKPTLEVTLNEEFMRSKVPEIGTQNSADNGDFGPDVNGGKDIEHLANIDFVREIVLTSSNPDTDTDGDGEVDASCDRAFISIANENDELITAMSSVETERQGQFTLTFENSGASVLFCWNGEELDDTDDPYVVLNRTGDPIIPASERDIRPAETVPN